MNIGELCLSVHPAPILISPTGETLDASQAGEDKVLKVLVGMLDLVSNANESNTDSQESGNSSTTTTSE